jgi:hypothetical protein
LPLYQEHEEHSDAGSTTKPPSSRTSKVAKTADSKSIGDAGGALTSAKPWKTDEVARPVSAEAVPTGYKSTSSGIADGTTGADGLTMTDLAVTETPTKKAQKPSITPLMTTKNAKASGTDKATPSDAPLETSCASVPATTKASAPKPDITAALGSSDDGPDGSMSSADMDLSSDSHDTVSSPPESQSVDVDTSVIDSTAKANTEALGNPGTASASHIQRHSHSGDNITPLPALSATPTDDMITADTVNEVAEATEVQLQEVGQKSSSDILEDY